ncbi:hypothetical protein THRCLA_09252 [Thraustotheca clavata]|uniref:Major Facilitator Superfamily (MFS) n=1 Tax=Thraustotheca clavata TaxID=74557 RepID=A0A1V9YY57_9STRA|nr:hypothetical protein THRCLA_09252 [Thraustotheca clavata]
MTASPPKILSRELVFTLGVIMTILTSGGLVLGFGPIYTLLVDEQQWHEMCPANTPVSEQRNHRSEMVDALSMTVSREFIFALSALLTVFTSGGLVLGFGPIYSTLVDEKQWHELCPENTPASEVCSDQEIQLQNVFSTGFLCVVIGQTAFGISLDLLGPRYTAISIIGNIFMSMGKSQDGTESLIVLGYALIGFGGTGILFSSLQLSELFSKPSIYCGILVAAFYASGYVYVLLKIPIQRASFFQAYAVVVAVSSVVSYIIFPVEHISTESTTTTIPGLRWIKPHLNVSKFKGLWQGYQLHLRRQDFWCFITIGSMMVLINVFVGGAIPNIVKQIVPNDSSLRSQYTNFLYPLVTNSSFVFAPLTGYIIERFGFRIAGYITIAEFVLLCGAITLPYLSTQLVSFVLLAMAVGSLTSIQYAYISTFLLYKMPESHVSVVECFPSKLYGLLSSTVTLVVFTFCLLSYVLTPLAQTTFHGNNNYVFLILVIPSIAMFPLIRFLLEVDECDEKQTQLLNANEIEEIAIEDV